MQRLLKLKKVLKNSVLASSVENFKTIRASMSKYRPLTEAEIQVLERNGNRSESWAKVMVENDFDPNRIIRSSFMGEVYLPRFFGTLLLPGDVSFPTGIYDSLVHNCLVENALVHKVAMLSNILVRSSSVVQNVGSIVSSGKISYMVGNAMHVGNEMGGRSVLVFPEINTELVDLQLFHKPEPDVAAAFADQLKAYREETALSFGIVGKGAVICNTNIIRNSWIGAHARIEGAEKIRNSVVLSSLEEPSHVYDSVILENSNVQMGVTIHTGAEVQGSVLMSRTTVACKAIVKSSIIAPCCHIEEGEVNSSYMGPMTQMHHHSLLIAALWPDGCGNLGYGANVGSNHTGRMPDQEVMPGQGMFFGLGVNVKFPANYRESPFTLIASGLTTLPQRVKFPFSLIKPGDPQLNGVPPRLNEIVPGWNYANNAYALDRNLYKYSIRGKGFVPASFYTIFSPDTLHYVYDAYQRLQVTEVRDFYTKEHIDGLGENFLRERVRQKAIKIYREYLERYALEQVITLVVNDPNLQSQPVKELRRLSTNDANKDVMRTVVLPETFDELLKRYRQLEKDWFERVTHGLDKDNDRGRKIFDDYDDAHPVDRGFTEWEKNRVEDKLRRLASIVKTAKAE